MRKLFQERSPLLLIDLAGAIIFNRSSTYASLAVANTWDECNHRFSLSQCARQFRIFAQRVCFLYQVKRDLRSFEHQPFCQTLINAIKAICLRWIEAADFQLLQNWIRENLTDDTVDNLKSEPFTHRGGHVHVHVVRCQIHPPWFCLPIATI